MADAGEGPRGPRGPGGPGGGGKFLLVSISRKMKGEKIAICWPKSWANRFRKFHFLELYKIDIFYNGCFLSRTLPNIVLWL